MTCSAIAALVPRRRVTVAGTITFLRSFERPYVRTEVELDDGTGTIVLRFMGRRKVPGIAEGTRVIATGTPGPERGRLVMLNPLYCLAPAE